MNNPPALDPQLARRYEAALAFLAQRTNFERSRAMPYRRGVFRLARMRELWARLGNPGASLPIVHVAGTKGKGSTSAMVAAVLAASGYRTGLFTSPHLDRVEERIAVNGQPCSPAELVDALDRVAPAVRQMDREAAAGGREAIGPTYFEITTAMGLSHFERVRADAVVLEVGLGGRLDSTNVCRPRVSVITSISLDHTRELGSSLESIAREKAGIIKRGVPVVSGVTEAEPREVIRRIARERRAPLVELGADFDYEYRAPTHLEAGPATGELDFRYRVPGREHNFGHVALSLLGSHQAANAAIAMAVLAELRERGWTVPERSLRAGLADMVWPARVELVARRPVVIVDAAHNPASIGALVEVLDESFSAPRRLLVFAVSHDKDYRAMLAQLVGRFDSIVFTRYQSNPRAVPPEELAAVAEEISGRRFPVAPRPADAWDHMRRLATPEGLVCITGSFFLAAEMRREIDARPLGTVA